MCRAIQALIWHKEHRRESPFSGTEPLLNSTGTDEALNYQFNSSNPILDPVVLLVPQHCGKVAQVALMSSTAAADVYFWLLHLQQWCSFTNSFRVLFPCLELQSPSSECQQGNTAFKLFKRSIPLPGKLPTPKSTGIESRFLTLNWGIYTHKSVFQQYNLQISLFWSSWIAWLSK